MSKSNLLLQVENLPKVPGVYLFKDDKKKIIYVGKAKNLKSRVSSYFVDTIVDGTKTKALVEKIESLDFIEVGSELEALLLESSLIKKYRPKYNIVLKDDKSGKVIAIINERIEERRLPVIKIIREKDKLKYKKGTLFFGPFPQGVDVGYVLRSLRRIFGFRDCSVSKFGKYEKLKSPCLFGHIGLCPAPCVTTLLDDKYKKNIEVIKRFLSGESRMVLKELENKMQEASGNQNYELALEYREILTKYERVTKSFNVASYIENPNLIEDLRTKAVEGLKEKIEILKIVPKRIECYDISNISGKNATASMTVSINGNLNNDKYRHFKIKTKNTPNDFEMVKEVLRRRLKRTEWGVPDLLVIDGGKGQVSSALEVLVELNLDIPVIGLAKREETIIYMINKDFVELRLEKSDESLKLLQRLRDEAHRFAKRYHHKLRLSEIKK